MQQHLVDLCLQKKIHHPESVCAQSMRSIAKTKSFRQQRAEFDHLKRNTSSQVSLQSRLGSLEMTQRQGGPAWRCNLSMASCRLQRRKTT